MQKRKLGRSGLEVSPVGMGCWAIGGPVPVDTGEAVEPFGWGQVDDAESIRALHRALDLGVNLFDTANNYGAGHSEDVLGQALQERREGVIISTKFATVFDETARLVYLNRELDINRATLREALEGSLRRLRTDYIDIYLLHHGSYSTEQAPAVVELLEELVDEGKIRYYGWSTDDPERARIFAAGEHCTAIEYRLNWMFDNQEMIEVCGQLDLGGLIKSPLHSGILTGKFNAGSTFPPDDGRQAFDFSEGRGALRLRQIDLVRALLTQDGRSLAQAALGYIWARSRATVPIPGFKSVRQVEENAGAMEFGPISRELVMQVHEILAGSEEN
jgi:aryl-alcohol dehydrogenase-like predicted oxidoreductase